jgi:hypothetical protein
MKTYSLSYAGMRAVRTLQRQVIYWRAIALFLSVSLTATWVVWLS